MKEFIYKLLTGFYQFRGEGKLISLFILALLVIYLKGQKEEGGRRQSPAVFLLSSWTAVAYVLTYAMDRVWNEKMVKKPLSILTKLSAVFLSVSIVIFSGKAVFHEEFCKKADNSMHIKQEYVAALDCILSDSDAPCIIAPPEIAPYLKMYHAKIETLYDYPKNQDVSLLSEEAQIVYGELSDAHPNTKKIAEIGKKNGYQYIIWNPSKYYPEFSLTLYGYEKFADVEGLEVYKLKEDAV